ncbi:hypothetical protein KR093_010030 [Drosophila rubida]|uniref:Uncharacterized protein n=1 Tax=Drosophila rubida TaxID=30044 RepID=A0AAD4PTR8_9MUSC|nr:hypothetical protein KR093_010030 [Drosophila rubida]
MLPMSATMGLGSPATIGDSGSRAGTPTNGGSNKSDIPAITVTASPGPGSLLMGSKAPTGAGSATATTPTSHNAMQMSMSGRSQCF